MILLKGVVEFYCELCPHHILDGNTPPSMQPIFWGANLIALQKKGGGVRPIVVGQTLRRLVAKCGGFRIVGSTSAALAPLQLGYGIPSGCEAVAHAARQYLEHVFWSSNGETGFLKCS